MWRRIDLVWTDVSEERIVSIFRVENLQVRNLFPPKRLFTQDLHGFTFQKTSFFRFNIVLPFKDELQWRLFADIHLGFCGSTVFS
jgi:hypothetical protein